jgi:hypothetical protein
MSLRIAVAIDDLLRKRCQARQFPFHVPVMRCDNMVDELAKRRLLPVSR